MSDCSNWLFYSSTWSFELSLLFVLHYDRNDTSTAAGMKCWSVSKVALGFSVEFEQVKCVFLSVLISSKHTHTEYCTMCAESRVSLHPFAFHYPIAHTHTLFFPDCLHFFFFVVCCCFPLISCDQRDICCSERLSANDTWNPPRHTAVFHLNWWQQWSVPSVCLSVHLYCLSVYIISYKTSFLFALEYWFNSGAGMLDIKKKTVIAWQVVYENLNNICCTSAILF